MKILVVLVVLRFPVSSSAQNPAIPRLPPWNSTSQPKAIAVAVKLSLFLSHLAHTYVISFSSFSQPSISSYDQPAPFFVLR